MNEIAHGQINGRPHSAAPGPLGISFLRHFLLSILSVLMLAGCSLHKSGDEAATESRNKLFQELKRNIVLPLEARVQKMPASLFDGTRSFDQSIGIETARNYMVREPTKEERSLVMDYVRLLPPRHQRIFSDKVLAIYFIDGFSGAGLTDWVFDASSNTYYYYLVFNSALLSKPLDEWLSFKDNAIFDDSSAWPAVRIQSNTNYKALLYGLLHEGVHVIDYELGVTPYMDNLHRKLTNRLAEKNEFSSPVWLNRNQPVEKYDLPHRKEMNVYRIFSKKAPIPRSELRTLFARLKTSPFSSFYSSSTWNEHLADFLTYHHIENKLGGTMSLELLNNGTIIDTYQPTQSDIARKLEKQLRIFYE